MTTAAYLRLQFSALTALSRLDALRLHHAKGLNKTWSGLFQLINTLPLLKVQRWLA